MESKLLTKRIKDNKGNDMGTVELILIPLVCALVVKVLSLVTGG